MKFLSFAGKWMELGNIILSEVSHVCSEGRKLHSFSHMQNIDLIQMQQCYEKQDLPRGAHTQEGRIKEGN
jgi:hypothetical protein